MVTRPKRISMGRYAVYTADGSEIILQRMGRKGFKIIRKPGAMAPTFKRLRDAASTALQAFNPWPFTVEPK